MFTRTLCPDLHRQSQDQGFWHQEVCNNQWLCLLFWYERSLNSYLDTLVLWDISPPYSLSAGFSSKLAIPCPNDSSLNLLACHEVSSMCLNSVTDIWLLLVFMACRFPLPWKQRTKNSLTKNHRNWYSCGSGGWKSNIKVLKGSSSLWWL